MQIRIIIILALLAGLAGGFFLTYKKGFEHGALRAEKKAIEATNKAIDELADEADKARVGRALCVESGGVWSFTSNKCSKENP